MITIYAPSVSSPRWTCTG